MLFFFVLVRLFDEVYAFVMVKKFLFLFGGKNAPIFVYRNKVEVFVVEHSNQVVCVHFKSCLEEEKTGG